MEKPEVREELSTYDFDVSKLSKKLKMARVETVLLYSEEERDFEKIKELEYLLSKCNGIERSLNNLMDSKEKEIKNINLLEIRLLEVQERPEGKNKQEEIDSIQNEIKRIKENVEKISVEIKKEWQQFLDYFKKFEEIKKVDMKDEHEQNQLDDD